MNQNKHQPNHSYCNMCKNNLKYNNSILKTSNKQNQKEHQTLNVLILCQACFNENDYSEITVGENYNHSTIKIYMYDQKTYVNKKEFKKYSKCATLSNQKNERQQKLLTKLKEHKIIYTKDNLSEQYINTGNPNIDTTLEYLLAKQNEENDRLCKLLEYLKDKKLEYDFTIPAYKKFIKKGGNLKKVMEGAEIEKILIKETNYLAMLDMTDSDTAKDIAISKMSDNNKLNKYIIKKNTLRFD